MRGSYTTSGCHSKVLPTAKLRRHIAKLDGVQWSKQLCAFGCNSFTLQKGLRLFSIFFHTTETAYKCLLTFSVRFRFQEGFQWTSFDFNLCALESIEIWAFIRHQDCLLRIVILTTTLKVYLVEELCENLWTTLSESTCLEKHHPR